MSLRPLGLAALPLLLAAGAALAQPAGDAGLDSALKNLGKAGPATTPAPTTTAAPKSANPPAVQPKAQPPAAATTTQALPKTQPAAAPKAAAPATAPAASPVVPAAAPAPARTAAPAPQTATNEPPADDTPRGAPKDDYLFVAWCEGVLATHMQLYARVKPELDAISVRWNTVDEDAKNYSEQQIAGREAIVRFERAMRAAETASPRNLIPDGRIAMQMGIDRWAELGTVDARNQAYSWMNWELPDRCTRIATQLEARSQMAAPLFRTNTAAVAPPPPPTPTPVIPAPIPTAPAPVAVKP